MIFIFAHLMYLLTMVGFNADKDTLTCENFELIKKHILTHGDQLTYCNAYNDNPHYNLKRVQLYLNPSYGNLNTDPQSYTELVIQVYDDKKGITYYDLSCNESGVLVLKKDYKRIRSANDRSFIADIFKEMLTEQKERKSTVRINSPFYKDTE